MTLDFKDKTVVVAGGSRGIGRAIALAFAAAGARVSICARGRTALDATRAELEAIGPAHAAVCDLADGAAVRGYVAAAAEALGGIDVLVNNASGFGLGSDEAAWSAGIAVDVMATVRATQTAEPWLERAHGAAVVNITSISAYRASLRAPAYGAVKAAVVHATASMALALAAKRIRVNAIAPGSIEFPGGLWDERRRAGDPVYAHVLRSIPFGRLGTPEEVADVALFLASPLARWITGQTVTVDGGQLLSG